MILMLILEFLLSPELEDVICHALEAFSQRQRIINVKWMFSQAQWLFKCYKWFRRGRKRYPGSPGCVGAGTQRGEMPEETSRHQSVQLLWIITSLGLQKIPLTHMNNMDDQRNAGNNCSLCSRCTWRESKEWHQVEFQISKAIVHFPPREGIHTFVIITDSFISQVQLTGAMAMFKQA